jgi:hypothetical protein
MLPIPAVTRVDDDARSPQRRMRYEKRSRDNGEAYTLPSINLPVIIALINSFNRVVRLIERVSVLLLVLIYLRVLEI